VTVWVLVDVDGNAVADTDPDRIGDRYTEDIGASDGTPRRLIEVVLTVPLLKAVKLTGDVPAMGEAKLTAVA